MNKNIKKSTAIAYIIGIIAILLMLGVWPFGVIHRTYETSSADRDVTVSEPATEESMLAQVFVSEGTKLKYMDIYIANDVRGKRVDFAIFDGEYNRLYHRIFTVPEDAVLPGYIRIPTKLRTDRGTPYIFTIYGASRYDYEDETDYEVMPLNVGYEEHVTTSNTSVLTANYAGTELDEYNIACRMKYEIGFSTLQIILIYLAIIVMSTIAIFLTRKRFSISEEVDVSVGRLVRIICNPLIIIFTVIVLYSIYPRCFWGNLGYNIIFSYISVLMAAGLLLFYVNYKRPVSKTPESAIVEKTVDGNKLTKILDRISRSEIYAQIRALITSAAIAFLLWHSFEYMNGLYDIVHYCEARRMLIWFLIVLITTYDRKEIFNIFNAIWAIAGIPAAYFYFKQYMGIGEDEILYNLNAYILYFGGFVIINMIMTIVRLIRSKLGKNMTAEKSAQDESRSSEKNAVSRLFLPYAIPFAIFIIGLAVMANTRWWPGLLLAFLALLAFRLLVWKDAGYWLKYLCNGVLINFLAMVVFSLHHRPYHSYIYHRYNMTYYTVTMTATHLTLIMGAAAVRLYIRYKEISARSSAASAGAGATAGTATDGKISGVVSTSSAGRYILSALIPDMALFGMVSCYAIFTLSRTAYAAIVVMIAVGTVIACVTYEKKGTIIRSVLLCAAVMLASVIYMFPVTFSATRMIPAVFDDPVIYDYEPASGTIYKGTDPTSDKYMDIKRFTETFKSKVLRSGDTITSADDVFPIREKIIDGDLPLLASAATDLTETLTIKADEYAMWQLADASEDFADIFGEEEYDDTEHEEDLSNGRMDIFRSYLEQSNMWGHDEMGAILEDGTEASHAHNIYLQVIFDHGWVYGIYFVLFMIYTWIISVRALKTGTAETTAEATADRTAGATEASLSDYRLFIPVILTGFMVSGLAEWTFHACNPYGLTVCLAIVSMVFSGHKIKK